MSKDLTKIKELEEKTQATKPNKYLFGVQVKQSQLIVKIKKPRIFIYLVCEVQNWGEKSNQDWLGDLVLKKQNKSTCFLQINFKKLDTKVKGTARRAAAA